MGAQLNSVVVRMIEESVEDRSMLEEIREACRQHMLQAASVEEEVDKLVTYIMGNAPEVIRRLYCCLHDYMCHLVHLDSCRRPSMETQTWMTRTWSRR